MIIGLQRTIFLLVFAIASPFAYMHAPAAYGQGAGNRAPNDRAAQNGGAPGIHNGTVEERLLGSPHAYQDQYVGQAGPTAKQQPALMNAETVRPTTPTDRMLANQ